MSSELDDFLRRKQMDDQGAARVLVEGSGSVSPDEAARRERYHRRYGADAPQVAPQPLETDENVEEALAAVQRDPNVAKWLTRNRNNAAIARGGMTNLADTSEAIGAAAPAREKSWLESAKNLLLNGAASTPLGFALRAGRAVETAKAASADLTPGNLAGALGASTASAFSGFAGAVEAGAELYGRLSPQAAASRALFGADPGTEWVGDLARRRRQGWEKLADETRPEAKTEEGKGVLSGVESMPLSIAALVSGAFSGGATTAAVLMGTSVGGQSYGRARDYGLSVEQSALYGAVDAGIEIGTERLTFLKALDVGTPFLKRFGQTLLTENVGEQFATFGQDFNEWVNISSNEGKTFGDFLAERPDAAYQTAIAATTMTGALTSTVSGIEYGLNRVGRTLARTAYTEDTQRFAQSLAGLSKASVVLQRDRGSFEEFVRDAAEGTEATTVYVEAEQLQLVLNQSDLTVDDAFDMTGMTPEQLQEAVERGEDVAIPVEQYAARIAPTAVGDGLIDHLRLDPDDMSVEQAKVYLQGVKEELAAAAEQGAAQSEEQTARQASRGAVEGRILADLQTARRFTDDINETYASLVGAFYETQSAKLGLTAEEMFTRYPLRVQSAEVAEPTFDQPQGALVNVGLDIPTGGKLDPQQVRDALASIGVNISGENIAQSDTEQTFIGQLDRALTPEEAFQLSESLGQEAVAQFAGGQGGLFGPQAEKWGDFNPEFFLGMDGGRLSETFDQSAAPLQTLPMGVQGTGPGGRVRNWDLGEALTLRHMARYGRALDPTDPEDYAIALDALLEDYANQKAEPDNGESWYSEDIAAALEVTKLILPELDDPVRRDIFLTVVALLSPQQDPVSNWGNAIVAFTGYSNTGRFALHHEDFTQFGVKSHSTGLALFEHLINEYGEIGALVWLNDEHTGAEMEAIRRASGLFQNKADNYLPRETNKTESKLGVYIFGPKVGDFMLNSAGLDQSAVTVDLWMARTYNRVIGRLTDVNEKRAVEGGLADAMRGKAERAIVKQLVRDAAAQAGIAPSAMQAALWYFEQRLYRNHGIQAESTSFSDAAREAALRRGIDLDGAPVQGAAARSAEDARRDLEEGVRVYDQSGLNPLTEFARESLYPTIATRHADDVVYTDAKGFWPERLEKIAAAIGAKAVVSVPAGDPRLAEGVPLWHTRPPLNADGTITIQHFGPEGLTQTDPTRWGQSNSLPRSERAAIGTSLPRTYFGIASGQPGGYVIEFPGRNEYEARVPAERLYDVAADPDGLKQGDGVPALERRIAAAGYLGYWSNNEQLGLVATVFEPVAVTPAKGQVLHQDAVFYSALERAVEKTATNKASAAQWKATLEKTPGIKAEELEWTGLLEFLEMQEGAITREQLLEVVRGAGLRVDEVVLGEPLPAEVVSDGDGWTVLDAFGEAHEAPYATREEAEAAARASSLYRTTGGMATAFSSWSSDPSNETYRELLITLPVGEGRNPNRAPSTHWDTDGVIAHARFMDKTDADGKRVLFIEEVQSDWHQKGRDQGYEQIADPAQREAVARAERAVVEREQVIAEVNSDLRAKQIAMMNLAEPVLRAAWKVQLAGIREKAAEKPETFAPDVLRTIEETMSRQAGIPFFDSKQDDSYIGWNDLRGWLQNAQATYTPEMDVLARELDELQSEQRRLRADIDLRQNEVRQARGAIEKGIPNAPFRTDWPALVMKRMIRWAAEHGYERIAWTTGEQQAERYNLTSAVGSLTLEGMHDSEGYRVRIGQSGAAETIASNGMGQIVERGYGTDTLRMTEGQLREAFGNDIAQRLLDSDGETVSGEGLRVGGEGMKAFYDRNLVNITNKLVKKYGAKVGLSVVGSEIAIGNMQRTRADADARVRGGDERLAEGLYAGANRAAESMTQPGFDITPELADAAMGGFPLFQKTGSPRGQIAFTADLTDSTITLLRGADLSTFVHELGHFFFEVTNHMASQANAPQQVVADRDAMLRYLGVESVTEWENRTPAQRREGHERMARSFEAFLFEGRAPSLELRGLFGRLRNWMVQVYRTITRLDVELTDEVRGVFGRMIASDEAIAEAEADSELRPLFDSKPEGMSDRDWEEYQQLNADARDEAAVQLESRSLRDMRFAGRAVAKEIKRLQREVADQRAVVREEVEAELAETPVYRAMADLRAKDGDLKLNTGILKEILLLEDAPLPDAYRGMTSQDGTHPQQVAELYGFTSADHLLRDLMFASPFNEAVEAETDQRMRERFGDLNTPEEVEQAARAAVHNEVRGRFVATELAAIQQAPGKKRVLAAAAKRMAEDIVARLRIRDLRPGQYEAAERRAARLAQETGTTNIDELVRHKRNQLLQFNLAKAAHDAREEMRKAREYLTKFNVKGTRANIDVDYLDQIDKLLERYELRQISNREADRRKALSDWIEQQRALGFEPAIDPEELRAIGRKNWRDLTVEEMRGLLDAIRNIEHLGRLTKKLLTAKDKADLDTAAGEMAQAVRDNATRTVELPVGAKTWWESVKSGAADFFAMHRKIANFAYIFDGNQYGGRFWERFIRPMNERGNWQATRTRQANEQLAELFKPIASEDTTTRRFEPAIGRSISLEDRLMVALNMGNEANLQRLMSGDRWEYDQVLAVVAPLQAPHWDFVESIWRHLDSYRPEIAAKERRVSGVEPEWVEAVPFQVEVDGELRLVSGGYFPIKYDPDKNAKASADEASEVLKQMTRGLYTNAQTRRGHTKARVDTVNNRPLRKNFGVVFSHVNQVIHDLAWHEYLIDANRLLRHGAVDAAIREHHGPEVIRWLGKALEDIAIGDIPAQDAFEKSIRHLRTGVSIAAMGWSIWTSLLQPTGLTQSMSRIGARWVLKGIGDWIGNPARANAKLEWLREQSPFMRERGDTMQREISEIRNRIGAKSPLRAGFAKVIPQGVSSAVGDSYFYMIAKAQLIADVPTWFGQYEKSMAAGEDHQRAVEIADQAVIDSQGAGQTKDLAGIQRGSELMKLFTNFYSYFSATFNLMADRTTELKRVGPRDLPYYAIDMMLLSVVPATIASLMYQVLKGDDDEPEEVLAQAAQDNLVYMLGLMVGVREIGSALAGVAGYTGPAGARFFSETGRFGKQVAQGEIDEPLLRAGNSMAGILLHYPATQLDRTVRGSIQYAEGDAGPQAVLVGPPPQ